MPSNGPYFRFQVMYVEWRVSDPYIKSMYDALENPRDPDYRRAAFSRIFLNCTNPWMNTQSIIASTVFTSHLTKLVDISLRQALIRCI